MTQLVVALRYKSKGSGFDFRWGHWDFLLISTFRPQNSAGVDSFSNRHEYSGYLLRIKALRGDNLTVFMCRMFRNSRIVKLLYP